MLTKKEKETIVFCMIFALICCILLGLCWVAAQVIPDVVFPPSPYNFPPAMD